MNFKIKYIVLIAIAILILLISFYFYRQFLGTSIAKCSGWNKEIGQLLSQSNYCKSSQECETVVVAQGCCDRREYVNSKFYQKGALHALLAKYNKYCSDKDLCGGQDCPVYTGRETACQDSRCLAIEAK